MPRPAACWFLVPTTGGVNLLEATRRLAEARELPPGDAARYAATAPARDTKRSRLDGG